jgi:hypothetical protein
MTRRPGRRAVPILPPAAAVLVALALAGCGTDRTGPGRSGRPAPAIVATAITPDGVSLSPDHLGAGPVKLVITNMTDASQQVAVESTRTGSFHQETAPINPQDMAQLRAELGPGSYTVSVRSAGLKSASLAIGPKPTS